MSFLTVSEAYVDKTYYINMEVTHFLRRADFLFFFSKSKFFLKKAAFFFYITEEFFVIGKNLSRICDGKSGHCTLVRTDTKFDKSLGNPDCPCIYKFFHTGIPTKYSSISHDFSNHSQSSSPAFKLFYNCVTVDNECFSN